MLRDMYDVAVGLVELAWGAGVLALRAGLVVAVTLGPLYMAEWLSAWAQNTLPPTMP